MTVFVPPPADPSLVTLTQIQEARMRIREHLQPTPFLHSRTLSAICGAEVWLKFENLQFTASFKERGACNRLAQLQDDERALGVIAASAGNHAQGVAYHATRLGIPATIVMPRFTPAVKVDNTQRLGAKVVLHGDTFDDAKQHALMLADTQNLSFVHPYDDPAIIAGQGTLALEMLETQPALDTLVVAIGGGGMISGIATAAKAVKPGIRVVGVQTDRFPAMHNRYHGGTLDCAQSTIADGIAVREPGQLTTAIVRERVDDVLLVGDEAIEQAIVLLLEVEKTVTEGAGAAGLAAVLNHRERFASQKIGLILCGGNIDPLTLGDIIERGMVRAGRLARIRVDLRDVPGALARVTTLLAAHNANIEQVHHQRAFSSLPVQRAEVDFVLQTRGHEHVQHLLAALQQDGFSAMLC